MAHNRKWQWKRRDRHTLDWQYTVSTLCTPDLQVYRGWKGALTSNHSTGKTNPFHQLALSAKYWSLASKSQMNVVCVFHTKQTRLRFKCPKCNVGLYVEHDSI